MLADSGERGGCVAPTGADCVMSARVRQHVAPGAHLFFAVGNQRCKRVLRSVLQVQQDSGRQKERYKYIAHHSSIIAVLRGVLAARGMRLFVGATLRLAV